MPTFGAPRNQSMWGPLPSVVPPITVPAWSWMMSGCTRGDIGIYGFRNRSDYEYDGLCTATSLGVRLTSVCDSLGRSGREGMSS